MPCKRVVFADSHHAADCAQRLRQFAADRIYPLLLLERERELWVEFIPGEPVGRGDEAVLPDLAALLATLQKRAPRRVPLRETPWLTELRADLAFLEQVRVLDRATAGALSEWADGIAPSHVWEGVDCSDAIPKNFVTSPSDRLRAVDIESLAADQLLGVGAAKACLRWWTRPDACAAFLDALKAQGCPDYFAYFPFVELSFRAFWLKSSLLEGKKKFVNPGILTGLLESSSG